VFSVFFVLKEGGGFVISFSFFKVTGGLKLPLILYSSCTVFFLWGVALCGDGTSSGLFSPA